MSMAIFRKYTVFVILWLACAVTTSGCLATDKETVQITFTSSEKGKIHILYEGIKSDGKNEEEILSDFETLMEAISEEDIAEAYEEQKLEIQSWDIDINKDGMVFAEITATFNVDEFFDHNNYIFSNGEIIIIQPVMADISLTTNAELLKTKNNYILYWPTTEKNLQWTIVDNDALKLPNNLRKLVEDRNKQNQKENK